jgi:hypothetical protein
LKHLFLRYLFCLTCISSLAHAQSTFVRAFALYGQSAQTVLDPVTGGYVHIDMHYNNFNPVTTISRLDSLGQPTQTVMVNLPSQDPLRAVDLERMADGRYVTAVGDGMTSHLMVLDSTGLPVICKTLPTGLVTVALEPAPGGGFYALGIEITYFGGSSNSYGWLGRFDPQGDTVWTRTYDQAAFSNTNFTDFDVLPSGDIFVVGSQSSQLALYRISAAGQLAWAKAYPSLFGEELRVPSIAVNPDGQLLVGGAYWFGTRVGGAASFDTLGNLQWSNMISGFTEFSPQKCGLTASGDLVMVGATDDSQLPSLRIPFTMCISKTGSLVWGHFHRTGNNGAMSDIDLLPDGGYLLTAQSYFGTVLLRSTPTDLLQAGCQPTSFNHNVYAAALDTRNLSVQVGHLLPPTNQTFTTTPFSPAYYDHCATLGTGKDLPVTRVQVLPQPLRTSARIQLPEGSLADEAQLHITDLSGRQLSLPATRLPDGWEIQRGGLPAGIYAYQVLQGGQRVASGKLWIAD